MKKYIFAVLSILSVLSLVGCGSVPAGGPTTTSDAKAVVAEADHAASDESPATDVEKVGPDSFDPEVDEPFDGTKEYGLTDDEDLGTASGRIPDDMDAMDAATDDETAEEPEATTTTPADAEGIIICGREPLTGGGSRYTLWSVDPNNGVTSLVNSFIGGKSPDGAFGYSVQEFITGNMCEIFSADLTKMAVTKTVFSTGETHAGWLDVNGNFFDVNESVGDTRQSEFEESDSFLAIGFTPERQFVYQKGDESRYVNIDLPGEYHAGNPVDDLYGIEEYTLYTDYLVDGKYLVDYNDESVIYNSVSRERVPYVPGDNMVTRSAVASPDQQKIAFIATLRERPAGSIQQDFCYIIPVDGSSYPTKIEFDNEALSDASSIYISIIDWR